MAQFELEWVPYSTANTTGQRVSYRYKSVGDPWITAGFTPANDLGTSATTSTSPVLDNNRVVEFKQETLCTVNGPTINDNGIQEAIRFSCITPDVDDHDFEQATITLDLTNTDVTKVRFTLRKSSDNSVIMAATIVNRIGNSATITKTGLDGNTSYYWQIELYANINAVEVKSSDSSYLGTICSPYPFTTDPDPICDPITAITVTSIEIV